MRLCGFFSTVVCDIMGTEIGGRGGAQTPPGLTPEMEILMPPHDSTLPTEIPYGYCHCGCGQLAPIAAQSDTARGYVKGKPLRYIAGHNARKFPPPPDGYKVCCKCGKMKLATTEFFDRSKRDGLYCYCKECRSIARIDNRERNIEYQRVYYATHREQLLEKQHVYNATRRDRISERSRAWKKANPDRVDFSNRTRRARKNGAEGTHTTADVQAQYERQKGRCFWCGEKVGDTYHVDHIVPLARGGSNWPENLVIACPHCNTSRGTKLPHEWPEGGRLL